MNRGCGNRGFRSQLAKRPMRSPSKGVSRLASEQYPCETRYSSLGRIAGFPDSCRSVAFHPYCSDRPVTGQPARDPDGSERLDECIGLIARVEIGIGQQKVG